jgi:hypothetical protein
MTMLSGVGTAASLYGAPYAPAPAAAGGGGGAQGAPSPAGEGMRTTPSVAESGIVGDPTLWLVVILAAAIGLVSFSLRVGK